MASIRFGRSSTFATPMPQVSALHTPSSPQEPESASASLGMAAVPPQETVVLRRDKGQVVIHHAAVLVHLGGKS